MPEDHVAGIFQIAGTATEEALRIFSLALQFDRNSVLLAAQDEIDTDPPTPP